MARPISQVNQDVGAAFDRAMEESSRRWSGKPFEELERACIAAMSKPPKNKITLKEPPRLP